jgi:hypothetical protein
MAARTPRGLGPHAFAVAEVALATDHSKAFTPGLCHNRFVDLPVLVLDGGDVSVFASIADAAGGAEVYDIDTLRYIDADGIVLHATADGYQVRLAPTAERQAEELRARLEAFLGDPRVGMDPALASDPRRVAALLTDRQRTQLWPRWPEWLRRMFHGS